MAKVIYCMPLEKKLSFICPVRKPPEKPDVCRSLPKIVQTGKEARSLGVALAGL